MQNGVLVWRRGSFLQIHVYMHTCQYTGLAQTLSHIHNIQAYYHQNNMDLHTPHTFKCMNIWIYIFWWGDSKMNVPAARCRIPDGGSRKRRWCVRRTRRRSAARHVITPRQCTYWGRGDTGLVCRYTGLFCGGAGIVCGNTGLFCGGVGLFCGMGLLFAV